MSTTPEFVSPMLEGHEQSDASETFIIDDAQDIFAEETASSHIIGASTDPVKDYLRTIGRTPLLDAEQEVELAQRIEAGLYAARVLKRQATQNPSKVPTSRAPLDESVPTIEELEWLEGDGIKARAHLLEANLRLVVSLAKRYTGRGVPFLDIIQEGNKGLIRGVEKFDYTKGYKFSTYATWWIRQSITRGLADQGRTIRIPVHMTETVNKMNRVARQMEQNLGRKPTAAEIANDLDTTAEKVIEMRKFSLEPISINSLVGDGDGAEFGDLIEDTGAVNPVDAAVYVEGLRVLWDVLESYFTIREAGMLRMRFGLSDGKPHTYDDIGRVYGVTHERARQITVKALAKLRSDEIKELLKDFLD